ncbi:MAG TPA: DUF1570 domain-containing protein, partial [Planctomycetota bacterium]|nr:DUF1570 domain-containing protein [Planctomycetota bacterium]
RPSEYPDPLPALKWDMEAPDAKIEAYTKYAARLYRAADEATAEGLADQAKAYLAEAQRAADLALEKDPDDATARSLRGFVRFDKPAALRMLDAKWMPAYFRAEMEVAVASTDVALGNPSKPLWVDCKDGEHKEEAIRWREILRRAQRWERSNMDSEDRFFKAAMKRYSELEEEVGQKLKRKNTEGATFQVYGFSPYALYVLKDAAGGEDRIAEQWIEQLDQVKDTFFLRFGKRLGLDEMTDLTPVLVLRSITDYMKYKGDEGKGDRAIAHFEPWSGRLVTWAGAMAKEGAGEETVDPASGLQVKHIRGVVFHEATHQLVHFITRESGRTVASGQSMWFSEGIAEYFGGHSRHWDAEEGRWRYVPGRINEFRLPQVVDQRKQFMPLSEFIEYLRSDFVSDGATSKRDNVPLQKRLKAQVRQGLAYAQGWALVYFLNEWDGGKYRAKFDDYIKAERVGQSGLSAFRRVFGNDFTALEKEFFAACDEIVAAARENRIENGVLKKK